MNNEQDNEIQDAINRLEKHDPMNESELSDDIQFAIAALRQYRKPGDIVFRKVKITYFKHSGKYYMEETRNVDAGWPLYVVINYMNRFAFAEHPGFKFGVMTAIDTDDAVLVPHLFFNERG